MVITAISTSEGICWRPCCITTVLLSIIAFFSCPHVMNFIAYLDLSSFGVVILSRVILKNAQAGGLDRNSIHYAVVHSYCHGFIFWEGRHNDVLLLINTQVYSWTHVINYIGLFQFLVWMSFYRMWSLDVFILSFCQWSFDGGYLLSSTKCKKFKEKIARHNFARGGNFYYPFQFL